MELKQLKDAVHPWDLHRGGLARAVDRGGRQLNVVVDDEAVVVVGASSRLWSVSRARK
jgi:hypothetical protein